MLYDQIVRGTLWIEVRGEREGEEEMEGFFLRRGGRGTREGLKQPGNRRGKVERQTEAHIERLRGQVWR